MRKQTSDNVLFSRLTLFLILCLAISSSWSQEAKFPNFRENNPLPEGRHLHGAAVLGDYAYVIGGSIFRKGFTRSVRKSFLSPQGELGVWKETAPLPGNRSYIGNNTVVMNDIVYIVGGWNGEENVVSNTILWARPMSNGDLYPWESSGVIPGEAISLQAVAVTPGYLHIIGGKTVARAPTNQVMSVRLDSYGRVAGWETAPTLPIALYHHNAATLNGCVWVWGGRKNAHADSVKIFSAPVLASGKLGSWEEHVSRLPVPFHGSGSIAADSRLISVAPRMEDGGYSSEVWFSKVLPGGLIQWRKMPLSVSNRVNYATAVDYRRGLAFIIGGKHSASEESNPQVFHIRPSECGRIEMDQQTGGKQCASDFPHPPCLTFQVMERSPSPLPECYLCYERAREKVSASPSPPLVLYFHCCENRECIRQDTLISPLTLSDLKEGVVISRIEAPFWPQLRHQIGVVKTPTWIIYDSRGHMADRFPGVVSMEDLAGKIKSCM